MNGPRSRDEEEETQATGRGNIAALIAVIVIIGLGYLAFNFIHERRLLQDCIDSGRHDCQQRTGAGQ